jgi:hypothetical protein
MPGMTAWAGYPVPYLFQNGEQGWWYDPSDFSTLFQDAAGTTPVTAVEQPCSLMLDKRLGLTLGSELRGSFSTAMIGTATAATYNSSTGVGTVNRVDIANQSYVRITGLAANKYFKVAIQNTGANNAQIRQDTTGTVVATIVSGASLDVYVSTAVFTDISIVSTGGAASFVLNSVRELPGNHAFTPAAASTARPTVSARVNLLTKTEQFDDAVWVKGGSTSVTSVTTINFPSAGSTERVFQNRSGNPQGATYTFSIGLTGSGTLTLFMDVDSGSPYQAVGTTQITLSSTPQIFTITGTFTSSALGVRAHIQRDTGDTATSAVVTRGADLRVANDGVGIPDYQRVNTATDYDVSGFPVYLRADGSNDFLQTNSIDFTGTDKVTLCAGVRKQSDAATGAVVELSSDSATNAGAFVLLAPSSLLSNYAFRSRGSANTVLTSTNSVFAPPITNVVSGLGDIPGDSAIIRVNGTQAASSTENQGAGNYGNYPLYLFSRAGTQFFFNGRFYGSVGRGAQSNDQQIAALEGYMNNLTKAY